MTKMMPYRVGLGLAALEAMPERIDAIVRFGDADVAATTGERILLALATFYAVERSTLP